MQNFKNHLGDQVIKRMKYRQWQKNLTVSQMYETISLTAVGERGADPSNWKLVEYLRLKA